MNEKKDNIYIYLWEDLNTIYVGRTINPKSRNYQHKHREKEKTYQFSSGHHVEHPNMIIIENNLTLEEGIEREKYWIEYYRNNSSYSVLNKSDGGAIGNIVTMTKEEREKRKDIQREKARQRTRNWNANHLVEKKINDKIYRDTHKEEIRKKSKEYSELNKEKISQRCKEWRDEHKEDIKRYRETHREEIMMKNMEYRNKHRDEINSKQRKYYQLHKEEIKRKQRERYGKSKEANGGN